MKKVQEIRLLSNGQDFDAVINESIAFCESINLSEKDTLRVRLLTEETMAMVRTLTGELELTLSFISQDNEVDIKVETDTELDPVKKEEILSVSSSGENTSAKGIMGKIRDAFETAFMMPAGTSFSECAAPSLMSGAPMDTYTGQLMDTVFWTLSDYRNSIEGESETEDKKEHWDELEKSIVSSIADDVQVGVRGKHVVMNIVYKTGK